MTLPDKSEASLLKGVWFVHDDGDNIIRIHGSSTAKERIYLNESLVFEKRSLALKSEHNIKDDFGNSYIIELFCTNVLKGEMTCAIIKNGKVIKSFHTEYVWGQNNYIIRLLLLMGLTAAFTIAMKYLQLPEYFFYLFISTVLFVHFLTRKKDQIEIIENPEIEVDV